jgi:hypothetical protein
MGFDTVSPSVDKGLGFTLQLIMDFGVELLVAVEDLDDPSVAPLDRVVVDIEIEFHRIIIC